MRTEDKLNALLICLWLGLLVTAVWKAEDNRLSDACRRKGGVRLSQVCVDLRVLP